LRSLNENMTEKSNASRAPFAAAASFSVMLLGAGFLLISANQTADPTSALLRNAPKEQSQSVPPIAAAPITENLTTQPPVFEESQSANQTIRQGSNTNLSQIGISKELAADVPVRKTAPAPSKFSAKAMTSDGPNFSKSKKLRASPQTLTRAFIKPPLLHRPKITQSPYQL